MPNRDTVAHGQTYCPCKRGFYQQTHGQCVGCPADHFKETLGDAEALCLPCPAHSKSVVASGNRSACSCNRAWYSESGQNGDNCLECPPGSIKPEPGPHACTSCPRGREPDVSRTLCFCKENTYATNKTTGECENCTRYSSCPYRHFWTGCTPEDYFKPAQTLKSLHTVILTVML